MSDVRHSCGVCLRRDIATLWGDRITWRHWIGFIRHAEVWNYRNLIYVFQHDVWFHKMWRFPYKTFHTQFKGILPSVNKLIFKTVTILDNQSCHCDWSKLCLYLVRNSRDLIDLRVSVNIYRVGEFAKTKLCSKLKYWICACHFQIRPYVFGLDVRL